MPPELIDLLAQSAVAAYLTKVLLDLIRQRAPQLDGNVILVLGFFLGLVLNLVWAVYTKQPLDGWNDYAKLFLEGLLALLGAVIATEAQTAAKIKAARAGTAKRVG